MQKNKYAAEVEVDALIDCSGAKSGTSASGNLWMLVPVKAQEGYNKLTLFVSNAKDCENARYIKVKKIQRVSVTSRKANDGKYYTDTSVTAKCEALESNAPVEIPFEISDDPLKDLFG